MTDDPITIDRIEGFCAIVPPKTSHHAKKIIRRAAVGRAKHRQGNPAAPKLGKTTRPTTTRAIACLFLGHTDPGEPGGLYEYRCAGPDRQHPIRRGTVSMIRVGYECGRCGKWFVT